MTNVFWIEGGSALHRRAACPALDRDLGRANLEAVKAGGAAVPMRTCDLDAEVVADGQSYPPDDLGACPECAR